MMVTDAAARAQLAHRLDEVLGAEEARTLMEMVAPERFEELATRDDVDGLRGEMGALRSELRGEMGELRTELRGEMGDLRTELRGEMDELRTELRGEMGALRSELRGEMELLRNELLAAFRGELNDAIVTQTRSTIIALVGTVITMGAIAISIAVV